MKKKLCQLLISLNDCNSFHKKENVRNSGKIVKSLQHQAINSGNLDVGSRLCSALVYFVENSTSGNTLPYFHSSTAVTRNAIQTGNEKEM